jgi:hypothetical protein
LGNPQEFLKTLSPEGVRLLERVQSLPPDANVQIGKLNNEEALNFILPHTQKVDLNNDALIAGPNGGKSFQFPPPNASQSVKNAWNVATENMSEGDKMLLSGQFLGLLITQNIEVDDFGKASIRSPDDPDWENPYADENFSYRDAVAKLQASNEFGKPYNTPSIYEKTKELLAVIGGAFEAHDIA